MNNREEVDINYIIDYVYNKLEGKIHKSKIKVVLSLFLETFYNELLTGKLIDILGFGKFHLRRMKYSFFRNNKKYPQYSKTVNIERDMPQFILNKYFSSYLNSLLILRRYFFTVNGSPTAKSSKK